MKRAAVLVALVLLGSSTDAEAKHWWGWLEEFSGPGPLQAIPSHMRHATVCIFDNENENHLLGDFNLGSAPLSVLPRLCVYADHSRFRSDRGRGFPELAADVQDFGVTMPLGRDGLFSGINLGAGVGWITFVPDPDRKEEREIRPFNEFTLTLMRLEVRPLSYLRLRWKNSDNVALRLLNVPKVWVKQTVIFGTLTGERFGGMGNDSNGCVPEPQNFCTRGDIVRSFGFVFDFSEMLGATPWF